MPDTWFLAPDFTFTTDGPLQLGMVISHWSKPNNVLADLSVATTGEVALPNTKTIVEHSHGYKRSSSRATGVSIWSKFEGIASLSASGSVGKSNTIDYGAMDHEIRMFSGPVLPDTAAAITKIPAVRSYIESGMFGKRAVYIVSGLRIATTSFTVTTEKGSHRSSELKASGPPAGPVPVQIGGKLSYTTKSSTVDTYETAPGIIFAYCLHAIRTRRSGLDTGLFHHRSAFLTGSELGIEEPLVVVEATENEIKEDLEEEVEFESARCGDDAWCIYETLNM
ncbi:hypothetical protein IQ06DRAFT_290448 [Phaeosphaeriaceae sp. SRC1lsM3a]|nr:hypothetical protein IQ06DRAFT_290448 [Stagonospora sp. SRC1lsM3a]